MSRLLPPLLAFLALLAGCETAVRTEWLNPALFPAPTQIGAAFFELREDFARALSETAAHTLAGFLASAIAGLILATVFSLSPWLRRAILPFAIFFQTVPIIAVAPLLVIYFGFGSGTVIASALIVSLFPVLANALLGLESVDPGELELFRLYGAGRWQVLRSLRLPRAYPSIYAGLKVAAGLAVIGAVAGEFVAGGGLGGLIDAARTQQRIDLVFAALLLLSALGLAMIGALRLIHEAIHRVRPYGINLKD